MTRRAAVVAAVAAWALAASAQTGVAHPNHVSTTELEHNRDKRALQAAIHVKAIDLEEALSRRAGHRVDLDETANVDELLAAYVGDAFVVARGTRRLQVEYVGKEISIEEAWIYVRVPVPNGLAGVTLRHKFFHEIIAGQVNTVLFRDGDREATYRFRRATGPRRLAR